MSFATKNFNRVIERTKSSNSRKDLLQKRYLPHNEMFLLPKLPLKIENKINNNKESLNKNKEQIKPSILNKFENNFKLENQHKITQIKKDIHLSFEII